MNKRNPDHEMEIMRRGLRDLAELSPAGRDRVLRYLSARVESLPGGKDCGPQQLDIEDAAMPLRATGGIAA